MEYFWPRAKHGKGNIMSFTIGGVELHGLVSKRSSSGIKGVLHGWHRTSLRAKKSGMDT